MFATTLIPFLVVLSLVLTSWKLYYESNYFTIYTMEIGAASLFTISIYIIKYTQKSFYHTFQTMVYSDLLLSLSCILLRYFYIFPWIYTERELYKDVLWYTPLTSPYILVVGAFYLSSCFLISLMMWQSQPKKVENQWSRSKIRITTLLCLKAFECEILILISLFIHSEELDIVDMLGMFVFIIAILIMSCDDTSALLIQTLCVARQNSLEIETDDDNYSNQSNLIDKYYEYFVVETDESILVKHRE